MTQTRRMLKHARAMMPGIPRSVEIGKNRDGIETLCDLATCCYTRTAMFGSRVTMSWVAFLAMQQRRALRADQSVAGATQAPGG